MTSKSESPAPPPSLGPCEFPGCPAVNDSRMRWVHCETLNHPQPCPESVDKYHHLEIRSALT